MNEPMSITSARERARTLLAESPSFVDEQGRVNVEELAKEKLGIQISERKFEDGRVAGFLRVSDGSATIFWNVENGESRKRFTIAHEIGHYLLHADKPNQQNQHFVDDLETAELVMYRDDRASRASHLHEIQANQFAAELLMPKDAIAAEIEKRRGTTMGRTEAVIEMAGQFGVSEQAMAIRVGVVLKEMQA